MGKGKNVTIGYKYYLGLHMGLCRGTIDSLLEIRVGDRTAWSGRRTTSGSFGIHKPDLFGGTKAEGGIDGTAWLLLGDAAQTVPEQIKNWLGGLVPGFRGITTLFFDGMVCAMNPYPKPWKMKVSRIKQGWDGGVWYENKAQINLVVKDKNGNDLTIEAMNPAHMIYQCCVDRSWGRGMPRSYIDDTAFRKVADTLYEEKFGLCLGWKRQDTLDSFVQTILDHIGGVMYVDKSNGKMTLKLIRQDYIRENLPIFDMDSGLLSIEESSVSAGAETVNEVVVNWHDPISNQDSAVREQNLAGIQTSGATFSKTNDYPGIPTPELAGRVAKRDLIYSTLPLRQFLIYCDRRAWKVQPGDVLRLQDPTRGQIDIAVRVGIVNDGTLLDGKIKIAAIEDVFTMPLNATAGYQPPAWVPPDNEPKIARHAAYEVPYADLYQLFPKAEFGALEHDSGFYGMAAEKPTPSAMGYDLAISPNGGPYTVDGTGEFVPMGELEGAVSYLDTTLLITKASLLDEVEVPFPMMIGTDRQSGEIVNVTAMQLLGGGNDAQLTVERGVYDTVPQQHYNGKVCWFYRDSIGSNWTEYVGGDIIDGKCLPWTFSGGRFDIDKAPVDEVIMDWRFTRPYAPGHVLVNGNRWYQQQVLSKDAPALQITWTHRDRVGQQDMMVGHDEGNVGPETGQRYLIKVYDDRGNLVRTESGINATGYNYLWAQAMQDLGFTEQHDGSSYPITVELWSQRAGTESWQYYRIPALVQDLVVEVLAAQAADQTMQTSSMEDPTGIMVAYAAPTALTEGDEEDPNGVMVSTFMAQANQYTVMPQKIDSQAMEYPYINLLADGFPTNRSRVLTVGARPSDRLTDSHELWTVETDDKGNVTGTWNDAGAQAWTPWVVLDTPLQWLDTQFDFTENSGDDGVALFFNPGDLAIIDSELVRIESVSGGRFTIARGCADTIPSRHGKGAVMWLYHQRHGQDTVTYDDQDYVGVKLQPLGYTAVQMPLSDIVGANLQMAYRYKRPYAPGLMLVGGEHWFTPRRCYTIDTAGNVVTQDTLLTWKHRNRLTQGETVIDHWHDNIEPEEDTQYNIEISYWTKPNADGKSSRVILRSANVSGVAWIYRGDWAAEDGVKAGRALDACGAVTVSGQLFAVRNGVRSWHGYVFSLILPTTPCPAGQPPGGGDTGNGGSGGGGTGGGDTGAGPGTGGGGGSTTPPTKPGGEDPDNPDNPPPEKPPEKPTGPDPDEQNPPPDPKPDEPDPVPDDFAGKWGINWDHDWARDLPTKI